MIGGDYMPMPKKDQQYTYKDYLTWPEDEHWEIIDGVPYMQAAPMWEHQDISMELSRQFANYFLDKPCKVFASPFDLCLEETEDSKQVTQPDLVVVCDEKKLKGTGYFGVPTLVVEIISKSSVRMDRVIKFNKFREFGVKEYWIIEPIEKIIQVFTLQDNGKYEMEVYVEEDKKIDVDTFPGLQIDLTNVFPE
jgi:Uma2 family endonuclease